MPDLQPRPEDLFAFGLWTVGHQGRDPFGDPVRPWLDPAESLKHLAGLGVWGVSFHDDDLLSPNQTWSDRSSAIARFKAALESTGVTCSMATTNLFTHPVFREGAFTANDPAVRRFAVRKVMDSLDVAVDLGARICVCWGGREGVETDTAKDARAALARYREGFDILGAYVADNGYDIRFALEPKPNEPRGDIFLPTVGHMLAFITTLERPELFGVNPEIGHEQMSNLNVVHGVSQALSMGKLFHIDLNAQRGTKYDQDLRFGSEDQKGALLLVDLLERSGYAGPRHFDCRAYRTEDPDGVWDFARGCMRNYLILKERAAAFRADPEVRAAMEEAGVGDIDIPTLGPSETWSDLRTDVFDADERAKRGAGFERLDQLLLDHLFGVRP